MNRVDLKSLDAFDCTICSLPRISPTQKKPILVTKRGISSTYEQISSQQHEAKLF